jgi:methanogenic corrinoid protein MtbC1
VALLRYLSREMAQGRSIGELAALGRTRLLNALAESGPAIHQPENRYQRLLDDLVAALQPLDDQAFERRLNGAIAVIPFEEALREILLPLEERVGELWHESRVDVGVEHYVTKLVQQKIFSAMNHLPITADGSSVIVACPPGEWHEIGAQAAAYLCAARGCRTHYLGANVPIAALGAMTRHIQPRDVLLSLSTAFTLAQVREVIRELKTDVLPHAAVSVGGAGAVAHRDVLEAAHITVLDDLPALDRRLRERLRRH